jgi:hypothetical protein
MILPPQYAWFEPVLFAAIIVFLIDLAGSVLVFGRRPVLNALASALLFALIFGVLVYYGYGRVEMTVSTTPAPNAPAKTQSETGTPPSAQPETGTPPSTPQPQP